MRRSDKSPDMIAGSKEIVEPLQSFLEQSAVYIIEQIVDILHRDLDILETQLKRELCLLIEVFALRPITLRQHTQKSP
ncbi:MAG: hypothetical protein ABR611_06350 [Chthoniobacterales bacterium]